MEISNSDLSIERTWDFGGLPAVLSTDVVVSTTGSLDIVAGQIIKSKGFQSFEVYGKMRALGEVGKPVIFTSYRDDSAGNDTNNDGPSSGTAGDWDRLFFDPNGAVELSNMEVRYAGNRCEPGNAGCYSAGLWFRDLVTADSPITVDHVQVLDSDNIGIYVEGGKPNLAHVAIVRGSQ